MVQQKNKNNFTMFQVQIMLGSLDCGEISPKAQSWSFPPDNSLNHFFILKQF